jgi:hypothetical protein
MTRIFGKLILTSLILSTPLMVSAAKKDSSKANTAAVDRDAAAKAKLEAAKLQEEAQKPAINAALVVILNQITMAKVTDFNIELGSKTIKVDGVEKSVVNLKYLDISALIKFKDELQFQFVEEKKTEQQLRKVVPSIRFTTKDMYVVAAAKIEKKGTMKVRFCQSYTFNNDSCNTFNDEKLLEVNLSSPNFQMFTLKLKEINIEFDQQISDDKFSFKGTCIAWKTGSDPLNPDKTIMKPADCSFSGQYDGSKVVKFDYDFKFVSKKP